MSEWNGAGYPPPSYTPPPGQSVPLAPLNAEQPAAPYSLGGPPPPPAPGAAPAPQGGFSTASVGYPTAQGSYPTAPAGYPMASAGYPAAPGGYPTTSGGYPAAGGYPMSPGGFPISAPGYYGYAPPSGRRFWGLQFLVYVPYIGAIVAVIVSLVQRSAARQSPFPIVRENARWAANWALSFLLYVIASYALIVIVGFSTSTSSYDSYGSYDSSPSGWIGIPVLLLLGIGVYSLVTTIRGCVVSDRNVHRPALAIPFLRD